MLLRFSQAVVCTLVYSFYLFGIKHTGTDSVAYVYWLFGSFYRSRFSLSWMPMKLSLSQEPCEKPQTEFILWSRQETCDCH